jgi:hypothetical protein
MEKLFIYTNPLYWIFIGLFFVLSLIAKCIGWVRHEISEWFFLWFELHNKGLKFWEDSVKNYNEHKKHFNKKMVNRFCKRKAIKLIRKHYSV